MKEELTLRLKDGLSVTSLDGEGLVLELDTRRIFWINETASFFLGALQINHEGIPFSSIKELLKEQYLVNNGDKAMRDFSLFIDQLKGYDLVSLQQSSNGRKFKNPNIRAARPYLKPMIKEETEAFSIGAAVRSSRATRMAAERSRAMRSARESGFKW